MKRFKWDDSKREKLKQFASKLTLKQAAKELGCTGSKVSLECKRLGVSFRKWGENHNNGKRSNEDVRLVKLLLAEGLTQRVIAEKMEISQPEVSMIKNGKYRVNG